MIPPRNGTDARRQGFPLSANPNCIGTAAHMRWAAQWYRETDRLVAAEAVAQTDGRATLWL